MTANVLGLDGIDFVEFASPEPETLHRLFLAFGFSRVMRHAKRHVDVYKQHDITFLLNREPNSFADGFAKMHGPSIASMGWRAKDAGRAWDGALTRGAKDAKGDLERAGRPLPAVYGIGDSLIYLVDGEPSRRWESLGFVPLEKPDVVAPKGFSVIDHLTNNVEKGTMKRWAGFYKDVFGFTEVRYFDIRGAKTGLTSYALRSPCGKFCIPINEADEAKSQINEYLDEYKGPGIQHLAFLTDDILASLRALEGTPIEFLDMDADYYEEAFARVPNVVEDHAEIQRRNVLVDGDADGYLLQIFTKNLIGPIFIELIQRRNHLSFGEGNFGALFRSIEREQARRGVFGLRRRRVGPDAMADTPITHVSDTAYLVAHLRAVESARPDALFRDPLAARLAGERGRLIAEAAPHPMIGWQVAMRTLVIDRFLRRAIEGGVDVVVNLGAGLDTRPYRLDLPAALRWVEVDYASVQELKIAALTGETARCRVERVSLDLADLAARRALFARIDAEAARILVLTEGVVPYLTVDDAGTLAGDLRAMQNVAGWVVDYVAPEIVRFRRAANVDFANAPFRFEPADWHAFFAAHGWRARDVRYLADEAADCDRPPLLPPAVAQSEGFRTSMGYVLLEPAR